MMKTPRSFHAILFFPLLTLAQACEYPDGRASADMQLRSDELELPEVPVAETSGEYDLGAEPDIEEGDVDAPGGTREPPPDGKVPPGEDPDDRYTPMKNPDKYFPSMEDPDFDYEDVEPPDTDPKEMFRLTQKAKRNGSPETREKMGKIDGHGSPKAKAAQHWHLTILSHSTAKLDWYISDPNITLQACWKVAGTFSLFICNQNAVDITQGAAGVIYNGLDSHGHHHFSKVIEDLDCDTKYRFHITTGSWQLGSDKKGTTLGCDGCEWDDSTLAFGGQYIIQGSVLEYTNNLCRVHRGDFNGDGNADVLRSCDNPNYNGLWYGAATGFSGQGYVITGSVLQNSANTCRLHVGDYDGNGTSDLLRTCNDASYNALWYGTPTGFAAQGYVITGSMLQNTAGTCRLQIGNFDGAGGDDQLRSCDDPNYNALWYGTTTGFSGQGYVLTGSVLQNSANDCRLHLGDFDADGKRDLLRSCNDPNYNVLLYGTSSGFATGGYVLTASVLQNTANTCRLHLANYNGIDGTDLLRTCDNPAYNALLYSTASGFISAGYVLPTTVLQTSSNSCRIHVADYDDDGRGDLLRTCDDHCFNALYLGTSSGFTSQGYVLSGSTLEHSSKSCRLHVGNYDGSGGTDLLRTCNDPNYNAFFNSIL